MRGHVALALVGPARAGRTAAGGRGRARGGGHGPTGDAGERDDVAGHRRPPRQGFYAGGLCNDDAKCCIAKNGGNAWVLALSHPRQRGGDATMFRDCHPEV
ncbi:hypothetical protein CCC_03029 [Paramagnetospirillum magnetotacticum MS-1]|uniref:Uncharacterized protein n=1 Tax=Paramagnetospirillum magnetotacticum MS-1 TaxID=272627 RepID=A0A0C2Z020_PARME|nr:hypothetical protein CCC_03029 [Paramagnetospirillum magnetotacticum MS-1]